MTYEMRGQFLEACDCSLPCPCWLGEEADEQECAGVLAWQIERGSIDGVDVSGLTVVSVSQHSGNRGIPGQHADMRAALLIDDRSAADQQDALARAFSGQLGGPLGELAEMAGHAPVERASIEFSSDGGHTLLSAADRVEARMTPLVGATKRITSVADTVLANLLASVSEICKTSVLTLKLPALGLTVQTGKRSAMRGRFSYMVGDDGQTGLPMAMASHPQPAAGSEQKRLGGYHDPFV